MSLAGFQQALAALVMSPALRQEVARLAAPELPASLGHLELTERERHRLHALARDPGMKVTTVLHRATRLGMLSNTVPRTCHVLGEQALHRVVNRYWSEHPPIRMQYEREAQRFGAFVRDLVRAGELVHALLPELLEAELAMLELGRAGRTAAPEPLPQGAALEQTRPRLSPWCRALAFRREPLAVLRALDSGQQPTGLPEGEHYLVLECVGVGQVQPHSVLPAPGRALLASTGEHPVARLCAELECSPALFLQLATRGWLRLLPPEPLLA